MDDGVPKTERLFLEGVSESERLAFIRKVQSADRAHRQRILKANAKPKLVTNKDTSVQRSIKNPFSSLQSIIDSMNDQGGNTPSKFSTAVLESDHPSPSEGQGRIMDEKNTHTTLRDRLAEIRDNNPEEFGKALAELGFVLASSIVTDRGWVRTSALSPELANKRRVGRAKRNKDYVDNLSPDRKATIRAGKTAAQAARRMEKKRQEPKPT